MAINKGLVLEEDFVGTTGNSLEVKEGGDVENIGCTLEVVDAERRLEGGARAAEYTMEWLAAGSLQNKGSEVFLVTCVCTVNILLFVVGTMEAWTSPVLPKLESNASDNPLPGPITQTESSWIGSLLSIGAIFGPFISCYTAEKIGRKWTLLSIAIPLLVAYIMLAAGSDLWVYYAARTISGLTAGSVFAILPMYVAEISRDSNRGVMLSMIGCSETLGMLLSYSLGPYVSPRVLSAVCACITCVFIVPFAMFMPETPQYFLTKGLEDDAKKSLRKLRSCDMVDAEIKEMQLGMNCGGRMLDVFTVRSNRRALVISVSLILLQQLSGINVVLFYAQQIFEEAGTDLSTVSPIILGVVQVVAGVILPTVVDRLGRRVLLMTSAVGMIISEGILGAYFHFEIVSSWLPIVCLVGYLLTFGVGAGPLPWTIMAELFPVEVKAPGTSITAASCWVASFVLTRFFGDVSNAIGIGGSFWIFTGCNVFTLFFVYFMVPETKGRSAAEIQQFLSLNKISIVN